MVRKSFYLTNIFKAIMRKCVEKDSNLHKISVKLMCTSSLKCFKSNRSKLNFYSFIQVSEVFKLFKNLNKLFKINKLLIPNL